MISDSLYPLMFAHRGTTVLAPENTVAAFDLAVEHGADVLETDVRLSRDGVVMVTHDRTVDRTTNGIGPVSGFSRAALAALDAGYRFVDPQGETRFRDRGLGLLTLDELFERYPHVGINIDIKDPVPAAAAAVAAVIDRHRQHRWVNVGSFHAEVLARFRALLPAVSTAAGRAEVARLYFGRFLGLHPRGALPYRWLQIPLRYRGLALDGRRFIRYAKAQGASILYWTVNDRDKMRTLLSRGADGVVTDRPDLAAKVFARLPEPFGGPSP